MKWEIYIIKQIKSQISYIIMKLTTFQIQDIKIDFQRIKL